MRPSSYATLLVPLLTSSFAIAFTTTAAIATAHGRRSVVDVVGGVRSPISSPSSTATSTTIAFTTSSRTTTKSTTTSISMMAIDYNDPGVMEEFNAIQLMEYDDVVAELALSGVRAPVDMGDMDVKLMLVELRTVMKGGGGAGGGLGESRAAADVVVPSKFGSRFEECLWTKPAFRSLYEGLKSFGDHNRMNVAAEYCNEPEGAKMRYMSSYGPFLDEIEMALNARPEVSTPTVRFGGFPANMGEFGLRMTLEALGGIVDMTVEVSDDGITLLGEVTFESVEVAKMAIEQYDGMDMGMGDTLKMVSI